MAWWKRSPAQRARRLWAKLVALAPDELVVASWPSWLVLMGEDEHTLRATAYKDEVLAAAQTLVAQADTLTEVSGEYRRHYVLAKLKKQFPKVAHGALAMVIEVACAQRHL